MTTHASPETVAHRLLRATASHSFDPDEDIDWHTPLTHDRWFLPPERVSLHGTPLWEEMTEQQRIELSRQELASYLSHGCWTELVLMRLFSRYLANQDPACARTQYALAEIADETRHLRMFARLHTALGTPLYRPPARLRRLFSLAHPLFQDLSMFALVLTLEEVQDVFQREGMRDDRVQPLVQQVFRIHVAEEARHVSFARSELREAAYTATRGRLAFHRELTGLAASLLMPTLLHPGVYMAAGLDTRRALSQTRNNPTFRDNQRRSGAKATSFLTEIGMITQAQRHWWHRAGLMT
jgi:hypothetical protein